MSGFFERPPFPEPEPVERFAQPEWAGAPQNVLGVGVPIRVVLVRTDEVAALIDQVTAYPTGLEFDVTIAMRAVSSFPFHDVSHDLHMWRRRRGAESEDLPSDLFRFGVEFADGREATSLDQYWPRNPDQDPPRSPILTHHGGGGGEQRCTLHYWLWPLPPAGPLAFVVEWPAHGIEETRVEIEAQPIRDAAGRAETLWPVESPSDGGWTEYGPVFRATATPSDPADETTA
jgi:hypothetical protein